MKLKTGLFVKELVMFLAVQFWGIFLAVSVVRDSSRYGLSQQPISFTWPDLIVLIVAGILFFLFIRYARHTGNYVFKIILALAIFSGSQITLTSVVNIFWAEVLSIFLVILFFYFNKVIVQNIAVILALIGIGTMLGLSLSPLTAVIVLVVLSFYDIWSVYITKHMVQLAEGMIRAGAIFGLVIPTANRDFFANTRDTLPSSSTDSSNEQSKTRSMILGSGDVVFPLVLVVSVARMSVPGAILVAIFSCVGLLLTHLLFVNQSERRPMAALPPIAMMSILGYLVFILI